MTNSFEPSATVGAQPALDTPSPLAPGMMPTRLQFSLSSLLLLTALMAVGMVVLKNFGHWGLVAITACSIGYTFYVIRAKKWKAMQGMVDLVWGISLPLLCFSYDPGIIQQDYAEASYGDAAIATALWQMLLLFAWLMLGPRGPVWNGVMAGGMIVGTILAGLLALAFTPMAIFFSLALGMGLPGFVPLMTTWVYARNWSLASFLIPSEEADRQRYQRAFVISLLLALLAPALLVWITNSLGWPFHFPQLPHRAVDSMRGW